jgi:hypothetical protein
MPFTPRITNPCRFGSAGTLACALFADFFNRSLAHPESQIYAALVTQALLPALFVRFSQRRNDTA